MSDYAKELVADRAVEHNIKKLFTQSLIIIETLKQFPVSQTVANVLDDLHKGLLDLEPNWGQINEMRESAADRNAEFQRNPRRE